jgi:hypothetical protein
LNINVYFPIMHRTLDLKNGCWSHNKLNVSLSAQQQQLMLAMFSLTHAFGPQGPVAGNRPSLQPMATTADKARYNHGNELTAL